jgi:hypothetical protein
VPESRSAINCAFQQRDRRATRPAMSSLPGWAKWSIVAATVLLSPMSRLQVS